MKSVLLIAKHEGETYIWDVNRRRRTKVLVDRSRYSSKIKYGGDTSYV